VNTNQTATSFFQEYEAAERVKRGESVGAEGARGNADDGAVPALLKQLVDKAKELPSIIQTELRDNPYRLLAMVAGVGFGVGAVLGSRIGRVLLLTVGEYALTETLRSQAKKFVSNIEPPT